MTPEEIQYVLDLVDEALLDASAGCLSLTQSQRERVTKLASARVVVQDAGQVWGFPGASVSISELASVAIDSEVDLILCVAEVVRLTKLLKGEEDGRS